MRSKLILYLILIAVITLSHLIGHIIFEKYIKKILRGKDEKEQNKIPII